MQFIHGHTYRFFSVAYPSLALNVYGTNAASTGRNVCLYNKDTDPDDPMQKWKFQEDAGVGKRLHSFVNGSYVLDRSSGITNSYENNAHLCATSLTSATDSELYFLPVSIEDNTYRIRLDSAANGLLYLTAANNKSGTPASSISTESQLTSAIKNVYWETAEPVGTPDYDRQCWTVVDLDAVSDGDDEETGGGTVETSYYPEGYYRFFTNDVKYLNANSNSTINLKATKTGGKEQFWSFFNGKLKSENYTSVGLAGTSSVTLSTNPATIQVIDKGNNECYIKNVGSGKYLYVSSNTLIWSNNKTLLKIESITKMNNVPHMVTEYFSANSGFPATTWQSTWSNNIRNLAKTIYDTTNNIADSYSFYNLYGAVYTSSEYKGGFHTGIDMSYGGRGQKICSPVTGTIVSTGTALGRVTIKSGNKYYILLHLDSERLPAKGEINKGDPIGFQSDTGVESDDPDRPDKNVHVHIEVSGIENASSIPDESFNFPRNTECPYY